MPAVVPSATNIRASIFSVNVAFIAMHPHSHHGQEELVPQAWDGGTQAEGRASYRFASCRSNIQLRP